MNSDKYAVIMAGGVGERFWPLSRKSTPKHLNKIFGDKTILENTVLRLSKLLPLQNIIIITNKIQLDGISKIDFLKSCTVFAEPIGRDTTAAIALACKLVKEKNANAVFGVFPSDAIMEDENSFIEILANAYNLAASGDKLVTIGIEPTFASTAYGYIELEKEFDDKEYKYWKALKFVEKPNLEKAIIYVNSKKYLWNSGMFIWSVSSIEKALKSYANDIYGELEHVNICDIDKVYPSLRKISIDFSVMENSNNIYTLKGDFGWDDVGSWDAVARHKKSDENGNVSEGECNFFNSKDNILIDKDGRLTAFVGVDNIVVVHTKDATLVCSKDNVESVKKMLAKLPEKYH